MEYEKQTHNSLGQPIHHTESGITAFHKWHKKSVIRDTQGRPQVVFHGTTSDFDEFSRSDGGNMWGPGHYFAEKPEDASAYSTEFNNRITPSGNAAPNVQAHYLNIQNPLHMDKAINPSHLKSIAKVLGEPHKEFSKNFDNRSKGADLHQYLRYNTSAEHGQPHTILQKAGIDGIVGNSPIASMHGGKTYLAFHPNQIKSAIGNSGKFSAKVNKVNEDAFQAFVEILRD